MWNLKKGGLILYKQNRMVVARGWGYGRMGRYINQRVQTLVIRVNSEDLIYIMYSMTIVTIDLKYSHHTHILLNYVR